MSIFAFIDREKALLLHSAINMDGVPAQNKTPGGLMGKDLHYCVLFNLILRARENDKHTIDTLKSFDYVPKVVGYPHLGVCNINRVQ